MLKIQNIEGLNHTYFGDWRIVEAGASKPTRWLPTEHYCIKLERGTFGAAILIDRWINPLTKQYHVYVCYENFDNRIYEGAFSKRVIMDKGHFLSNMMAYVRAEYEMRKQK
jgi:hypothetical protein